ncbi:hypothetical protein CC2G_003803 [Coprinopsis cinerea AmutBmut pab1-1]|nr:hypothetical protein CC2G_003803 [Coprinopsis cinerea AmutBmut pab1-1]
MEAEQDLDAWRRYIPQLEESHPVGVCKSDYCHDNHHECIPSPHTMACQPCISTGHQCSFREDFIAHRVAEAMPWTAKQVAEFVDEYDYHRVVQYPYMKAYGRHSNVVPPFSNVVYAAYHAERRAEEVKADVAALKKEVEDHQWKQFQTFQSTRIDTTLVLYLISRDRNGLSKSPHQPSVLHPSSSSLRYP